ncbi:hypothetical protein J6590_060325 [Homalodisca vitripennis]|nr:hypothetical protein J6590_060325 [Homalodisca vitripennis]
MDFQEPNIIASSDAPSLLSWPPTNQSASSSLVVVHQVLPPTIHPVINKTTWYFGRLEACVEHSSSLMSADSLHVSAATPGR